MTITYEQYRAARTRRNGMMPTRASDAVSDARCRAEARQLPPTYPTGEWTTLDKEDLQLLGIEGPCNPAYSVAFEIREEDGDAWSWVLEYYEDRVNDDAAELVTDCSAAGMSRSVAWDTAQAMIGADRAIIAEFGSDYPDIPFDVFYVRVGVIGPDGEEIYVDAVGGVESLDSSDLWSTVYEVAEEAILGARELCPDVDQLAFPELVSA